MENPPFYREFPPPVAMVQVYLETPQASYEKALQVGAWSPVSREAASLAQATGGMPLVDLHVDIMVPLITSLAKTQELNRQRWMHYDGFKL